jgi:hypothetical protein
MCRARTAFSVTHGANLGFLKRFSTSARMRDLEDKRAYRRQLRRAMQSIAWHLQLGPVYPSDTDDLEWCDLEDLDEHPKYEHPAA